MILALLTSMVVLSKNGPLYMVQEIQTKDAGFCHTTAFMGKDDPVPAQELFVPSVIGCFGLAQAEIYKVRHQCRAKPFSHSFDEVTGLTDESFICDKP